MVQLGFYGAKQRIHRKNSATLFHQLTGAPSLVIEHMLSRKQCRERAFVRVRGRTLFKYGAGSHDNAQAKPLSREPRP